MKLTRLSIKNFGPFVDVDLSLADRGLVLLQGQNDLSTSADSNGSGKSSLLEAVAWGTFGKTIRYEVKGGKPTGDLMVNSRFGPTPGKNCEVVQVWEAGGKRVEIARYRKHQKHKNAVYVTVDGNDYTRGTSKETDRLIEELIGLDFSAFIRSVYFDGGSIVPFPTLSDKEIKDTFEKVLGLDDLAKVAGVVKDKIRGEKDKLAKAENDARLEQAQASTADLERVTAEGRRDTFERDRAAAIAQLELDIKTVLAQPVRPAADIDADMAKIDALEKDLLAKLTGFDSLETVKSNWVTQRATKAAELAQAQRDAQAVAAKQPTISTETNAAALAINRDAARLTAEHQSAALAAGNAQAKIGTPCSECGKPYTADDLDHIVAHGNAQVAKLQAQIDELRRQHNDLMQKAADEQAESRRAIDAEVAAAGQRIAGIAAELAAIDAKKPKLDELTAMRDSIQGRLRELPGERSALVEQRHARERIDAQAAAYRADLDRHKALVNPYLADIERWGERKEQHDVARATHDEAAAAAQKQLDMLKVLDEAYGRTGLKAHILENITPLLNARANDYAGRLADGQVKIEFSTVTKLRDGTYAERFSVNVVNAEGAEGYLGNSSGEQRKIDLAIGLALSDLVAARSSKAIDLWVADEIAESLDPTAVDRVVDVLKDKAKERGTLLVISHTDMRDLIPHVMVARKTAAGTELVDGTGSSGGW